MGIKKSSGNLLGLLFCLFNLQGLPFLVKGTDSYLLSGIKAIYGVLCIMGDTVFVPKKFLQALFSPFLGTYWFITAYLAFYLLCPLLNILVQSLSQKQFRTFIGILTVIIPLFQMFVKGNPNWGIISTFAYLFILTAGLKRHKDSWLERNAVFIAIVDFLFLIFMGYLCRKSGHVEYINFFLEKSSIFIILEAFSIFFVFKNWKIKHSKLINQAAASVFGGIYFASI